MFPRAAEGLKISIHALHEESDSITGGVSRANVFQSTLSMRRATGGDPAAERDQLHFNPRSP